MKWHVISRRFDGFGIAKEVKNKRRTLLGDLRDETIEELHRLLDGGDARGEHESQESKLHCSSANGVSFRKGSPSTRATKEPFVSARLLPLFSTFWGADNETRRPGPRRSQNRPPKSAPQRRKWIQNGVPGGPLGPHGPQVRP